MLDRLPPAAGKALCPPEGAIQIHILGGFGLRAGETSVPVPGGQNSKLMSVLCYLALHRDRPVPQAELIETFYGDENQSNPAGALKMQIFRIRTALASLLEEGTASIIGRRGSYRWNADLPCWVDAEAFETLCQEAQRPDLSAREQIACYAAAMDLYQGSPALEKDGYLWSKSVSARFNRHYVAGVEHYAALLEEAGAYQDMETLCEEAMEREPTSEALRVLLIRALLAQGRHSDARQAYREAVEMLYRDLGVRPSQTLMELYSKCVEQENAWEQDLGVVMETMLDPVEKREAFVCGFQEFRSMYQLEVRRAQRTGGCLHVAMLTVLGADGKMLPARVNQVVMEDIQKTVAENLRQSDVVARYSGCQFILMLPYANQEDSHGVMDRVVKAYERHNPKSAIRLSWQIREMKGMELENPVTEEV